MKNQKHLNSVSLILAAAPSVMSDGEGLTAEQVVDALSNEEIRNSVVGHLSSDAGGNFLVMSNDDQQAAIQHIEGKAKDVQLNGFLGTFRGTVKEYDIKPEVNNIHQKYDDDLKEFGYEKEKDEPAYKAWKRVHSEALDKIKGLEKSIEEGTTDEAVKKQLEDALAKNQEIETNAQARIQEIEEKYKTLNTEYSQFKNGANVDKIYGELKLKSDAELGKFFPAHRDGVLNHVKSNHSVKEDGTLIMTNSDGTPMKDKSFNEITVESYLKEQFKDAISTQRVISGAGGAAEGDKTYDVDPSTLTPENFDVSGLETQGDLISAMIERGLSRQKGDKLKQWSAIYAAHAPKLKPGKSTKKY